MEKQLLISFSVQPAGCRSVPVNLDLYSGIDIVFEHFLWYIENSIQFNQAIDNVRMTYGDAILATSVHEILAIGLGLCNLQLEVMGRWHFHTDTLAGWNTNSDDLDRIDTINAHNLFVKIKAARNEPYIILNQPMSRSTLKGFIVTWYNWFNEAKKIIDDFEVNDVILKSPKLEDMSWTMEYCLPEELQRARDLLDTDPKKAKDILFVMQHMLTHYRKGK